MLSATASSPLHFSRSSSPQSSKLRFAGETEEAAKITENADTPPPAKPSAAKGYDAKNPLMAMAKTMDNYARHAYKTRLGKLMLGLDAACIMVSLVPFMHFVALAQPFLWMALYSAVTKKVLWTQAAQKS